MARKPADQSVHREDIILAAAEVLQRNGYEAATMKDIAAAVNLTAASLYHHFRNKDTLLLAVLELGLEVVIQQIEPIAASQQPSEQKLREMICAHIVGLTENTAVGAAMVFEIRALMNVKAPPKSASAEDKAAYATFIERRNAFFKQRDHFEDVISQRRQRRCRARDVSSAGCADLRQDAAGGTQLGRRVVSTGWPAEWQANRRR